MKKIAHLLLVTFLSIISSYNALHAQVTKALTPSIYSGAVSDVVTVDKIVVRISNLFIFDSIKGPHIATFEIDMGLSPDSKNVLTSLFTAAEKYQPINITVRKLNNQGSVVEERTYTGAFVEEIELPELSAASKEKATAKVTISAPNVTVRTELNEPGPVLPQPVKADVALAGNFKLVLGTLPAARVSSISNLTVSRQKTGGYLNFTVVLVRADSKSWKDWFFKGPVLSQRMDGTIMLMDPSMQNTLVSLQIPGVEIMSVSEVDNYNDNVARTTIGLRTGKVDLTK